MAGHLLGQGASGCAGVVSRVAATSRADPPLATPAPPSQILYIFPASTLPLTIKNVLGLLSQPVCKEVRGIFGVPFVYKLLSEDEEGIALLRQYDLCLYGGSVMPDEVGDRLVENGVKLVGHIGSTGASSLGAWPPSLRRVSC